MEKELDIILDGDLLRFEEFLHSQGILTNLHQLHSASKVTISLNESILGALDIMCHLFLNKHFYQMPLWGYREILVTKIYLVGAWYKCLRKLSSSILQAWWVGAHLRCPRSSALT